jgi:predicted RNA-binding protein YlxR (DUF448 family)
LEPSTPSRTPTAPRSDPKGPVRTCVGCRERAARSDLVRVVLDDGRAVVDETATRPGRGAWLHRNPECLELAISRKAFPRALRAGVADTSSLESRLTLFVPTDHQQNGTKAHGYPMSNSR